jgi:hypothetical protein
MEPEIICNIRSQGGDLIVCTWKIQLIVTYIDDDTYAFLYSTRWTGSSSPTSIDYSSLNSCSRLLGSISQKIHCGLLDIIQKNWLRSRLVIHLCLPYLQVYGRKKKKKQTFGRLLGATDEHGL